MCSREPTVPPWLWGVQILADHANMQLRKQKMPWELENFEGMGLLQLVIDFNKPLLEILIYLLQNLCFMCLRRALIRNWSIPGLCKSCSCKINLHWIFFFSFLFLLWFLGCSTNPLSGVGCFSPKTFLINLCYSNGGVGGTDRIKHCLFSWQVATSLCN